MAKGHKISTDALTNELHPSRFTKPERHPEIKAVSRRAKHSGNYE